MSETLENHDEPTVNPAELDEVAQDSNFGNGVIDAIDGVEPTPFPELNEKNTDNARDFLASIERHKNEIMSHFEGLISESDYNEIAKRAIGIIYQETGADSGGRYRAERQFFKLSQPVQDTIGWVRGHKGEYSRGYTQIQFNENFGANDKEFLETFGVKSPEDLDNPAKCGIATMVALIKKYEQFIIPMKTDPFWTNEADIIHITCNNKKDGKYKQDWFAIGKEVNGELRTPELTEKKIDEFCKNNGGIKERKNFHRQGFTKDDFFDALYYAWNSPSDLVYGTGFFVDGGYAAKCRNHVSTYVA